MAEFVCDPEILAVCRAEGVDFARGHLIGRPMPFDELAAAFLPGKVAVTQEG